MLLSRLHTSGRAPAHVHVVLTNKKSVWCFIAVEQRHSLGVKAQPQPHRQHKGSHQLQDRKQTFNKYLLHLGTFFSEKCNTT